MIYSDQFVDSLTLENVPIGILMFLRVENPSQNFIKMEIIMFYVLLHITTSCKFTYHTTS